MKRCTQAGHGVVDGLVNERAEFVTGNEGFQKQSTPDIFECNWVTIYCWTEFGEELDELRSRGSMDEAVHNKGIAKLI